MLPPGFEPGLSAREADVLAARLREHNLISLTCFYIIYYNNIAPGRFELPSTDPESAILSH